MAEKQERVVVAEGRTVYAGGGVHGFNAGDALDVPASHAAELREGGHVEDATPAKDADRG
jgi:hypothetical protein